MSNKLLEVEMTPEQLAAYLSVCDSDLVIHISFEKKGDEKDEGNR